MPSEKEKCAICGKTIAKNPVPYYHKKVQNEQNKMYRHEDCPGQKPEEIEE